MVPIIALVLCCALIPVALAAAAALGSVRNDTNPGTLKQVVSRLLRGRR